MSFKVRHLRGTKNEWLTNDYTPEDGEIALYKENNSTYRIKIGNGFSRFSILPSLTREVKTVSNTNGLSPAHNTDYHCGTTSSVIINIPSTVPDDYFSAVSFTSAGSCSLTIRSGKTVYYSGDALSMGTFVPTANARYTLLFWYDGYMRCHIIEGKTLQ